MNFKIFFESLDDKEILISLVRGKISPLLLSKLNNGVSELTPIEQETLFKGIMQSAEENEWREGDTSQQEKTKKKWFYNVFRKGRDFAEQKGWLTIPLARINKEIEDTTPVIKAIPYTSNSSYAFHTTDYKFLDRIKQIGLTPRDPHEDIGLIPNRAVFFFANYKETAHLAQGLLDDGIWKRAAILKIDITGLPLYKRSTGSLTGSGEEFYTNKRVLPNRIIEVS